MTNTYPDRIPFDNRINSQLSVARFYGGIEINGSRYELDYDNAPESIGADGSVLCKPDLVKVIATNGHTKSRKPRKPKSI